MTCCFIDHIHEEGYKCGQQEQRLMIHASVLGWGWLKYREFCVCTCVVDFFFFYNIFELKKVCSTNTR
jgi:hypothetical protein